MVCVLNRKGRALLLDCAACGEVARCEHCAGAMRLTVGEADMPPLWTGPDRWCAPRAGLTPCGRCGWV